MTLPVAPIGRTQGQMSDGADYLEELKQAYAHLVQMMNEMERVTRQVTPDKLDFGNVRWRLSQAGLSRRKICNLIYADLSGNLTEADSRDLNDLAAADLEMRFISAAHVAEWTSTSIEANWRGYCEASRAIRSKIMTRIEEEKRVLYPLLQRYEGFRTQSAAA